MVSGGSLFMLSNPYPRLVRSASVAGVVLTVGQVATVSMSPTGRVYYPGGWTSGYGSVVVGYEHGLSIPPAGAKQVALALAKRALTGAPADDRATSMSTDEQTTTFYVPGGSEPFDVPAANRFVASHTLRTGIA
jgi:streptogramin lyase